MYVTYFDEGGKCLLMEYYVKPDYRGLGYGKLAYFKAERYINEEGALYIELTPTNESNEIFWTNIGFNKSKDLDEDGMYIASVPALKGCHTQAKTVEELIPRTKEAIELCLELEQNELLQNEFVGVQQVEIVI